MDMQTFMGMAQMRLLLGCFVIEVHGEMNGALGSLAVLRPPVDQPPPKALPLKET